MYGTYINIYSSYICLVFPHIYGLFSFYMSPIGLHACTLHTLQKYVDIYVDKIYVNIIMCEKYMTQTSFHIYSTYVGIYEIYDSKSFYICSLEIYLHACIIHKQYMCTSFFSHICQHFVTYIMCMHGSL